MRIFAALVTLALSTAAFAETYYVRKTVAGDGVSVVQANHVREALQAVVTNSNNRLAKTPGDAPFALRAVVNKTDDGFSIKVEKYHGNKLQTAAQSTVGSAGELDAATHKTADSLVSNVATNVPVDNNNRSDVVVENYPTEARTVTAAETAPPTTNGGPVNAVEARHANYVKNWFVGLGPVITNNLLGANGTKYTVLLGYNFGLSERIDLMYFYSGDFNTASQGSTAVTEIAVGGTFYLGDRGTENTPFLRLDAGYGGNNKQNDASLIVGGGVGMNFFRTKDFTAQVLVRILALYTGLVGTQNMPNDTQVVLGIYF